MKDDEQHTTVSNPPRDDSSTANEHKKKKKRKFQLHHCSKPVVVVEEEEEEEEGEEECMQKTLSRVLQDIRRDTKKRKLSHSDTSSPCDATEMKIVAAPPSEANSSEGQTATVHPFFQRKSKFPKKKKKSRGAKKMRKSEGRPRREKSSSMPLEGDQNFVNTVGKDDDEIIHEVHDFFMTAEQRKRKHELIKLLEFRSEIQRNKELERELLKDRIAIIGDGEKLVNPLELLKGTSCWHREGSNVNDNVDSEEHYLLGEHNWQYYLDFVGPSAYISRKKRWTQDVATFHITDKSSVVASDVCEDDSTSSCNDGPFGADSSDAQPTRHENPATSGWMDCVAHVYREREQRIRQRCTVRPILCRDAKNGKSNIRSSWDLDSAAQSDLASAYQICASGLKSNSLWPLQRYIELFKSILTRRLASTLTPFSVDQSEGSPTNIEADTETSAQMWTHLYHPMCRAEICGNEHSVNMLADWLTRWKHGLQNGSSGKDMFPSRYHRPLGLGAQSDVARSPKVKKSNARANTKSIMSFFLPTVDKDKRLSDGNSDDEGEYHSATTTTTTTMLHRELHSEGSVKGEDEDTVNVEQTEFLSKSNVIVLRGGIGSGKTSAVYAIARELGFKVFEISPSSDRSKEVILRAYGEASQSHNLGKYQASLLSSSSTSLISSDHNTLQSLGNTDAPSMSAGGEMSLILLDEIDITFCGAVDKGFANAVKSLIATSKCPIVMTCKDLPDQETENPYGLEERHFLTFANIGEMENIRHVQQQVKHKKKCLISNHETINLELIADRVMYMKCATQSEGLQLSIEKELIPFVVLYMGDIRHMLLDCQFWMQGNGRSRPSHMTNEPIRETNNSPDKEKRQDDLTTMQQTPWLVERSMGVDRLCHDLRHIIHNQECDAPTRRTLMFSSRYALPICDELINSQRVAPIDMDLIHHNYMDIFIQQNPNPSITRHDSDIEHARHRIRALQHISSFTEAQSQIDSHWRIFESCSYCEEQMDDRTEQLLATSQLMHLNQLREQHACLAAQSTMYGFEDQQHVYPITQSHVMKLSCGLKTSDRLLRSHAIMQQQVVCQIAQKALPDNLRLSHMDHNHIHTLSKICQAEDARKSSSKRRRFFHHLHHIYDDTELQGLMNFTRPLRERLKGVSMEEENPV